MKKYCLSLLIVVMMALSCVGCKTARNADGGATNGENQVVENNNQENNGQNSQENNDAVDENENSNENVDEGTQDENQGAEQDQTQEEVEEVVKELPEWVTNNGLDLIYEEAKWLETIFENLTPYFADYNGETLYRIPGDDDAVGPAIRGDIVYYKTQETDMQTIINAMVDSMMIPLMETVEGRPYTITSYKLKEHTLYQVSENVWIIDCINGYYKFDGTDFLDMESYMAVEGFLMDEEGYMPFVRQGSDGVFYYLLIRDGEVYRLQNLQDMWCEYRTEE